MISRSHPLARRLRALRKDRDLRDREGVLVAEGLHLVAEALSSGLVIEAAVFAARLNRDPEGRALAARLAAAGIPLHEAEDGTFEGLQDARSPQPVVAVARRKRFDLPEVLGGSRGTPLVVVPCGLQDPGNLGSIVRTAEAAGATGLVAAGDGVDLYHPRTVRAAMGSLFRLPACAARLAEALETARAADLRLVGAVASGARAYAAVDWRRPVAILLGAEGAGLPEAVLSAIEERVTIPLAAGVESLSVGAAAAVILFEAARARR